jgi:hypothetical protein
MCRLVSGGDGASGWHTAAQTAGTTCGSFVRHEYTTREQQFLDVAVAEAEPVIQPDTMADALDRGAMILLAVGWG